jgi:hypothetical protein
VRDGQGGATLPPAAVGAGDLTRQLIDTDVWSDELVASAGIPIVDKPLVTVGGGIGSFVTVDYLRLWGMAIEAVSVLTPLDYPWQTYEYLTRCSQIPRPERLRSDSSSMPDNPWGFPSYALLEAWREKTVAPLWNVLTEPIFCDYWTPRAGTVFAGLQREADRIGYWQAVVKGQVRMVRRRHGGGYFTILTPPAANAATRRVAFRSRVVHIAVGYPGLKFLPDLQAYQEAYGDPEKVVNAYTPHEHVYEQLKLRPGVVVVRGSGIVASRILQRLIDDREREGAQTTIIHLFRTYISGPTGPNVFYRRPGGHGWAFQGFNYPKAVWGGELWEQMRKLEGRDRLRLYQMISGTNTPRRKSWLRQQERGRREGWYRTYVGQVREVVPGPNDTVVTRIHMPSDGERSPVVEVPANFIIDCTGLEADISEHRLLADLLKHSGAGRNVLDRLDVERTFEVRGTRSEPGRMYATGAATLGGYFPGVDTFLGLQLAAREVADDIASLGMVRRLGSGRSVAQWWRWMRGRPL